MINYSNLPSNSGCYIYRDKNDEIIYIGKAKDLKKRVSTYFQKRDHDVKTLSLIENISSIDYIVTDNEVEALLLENTLVKEHRPKYNIDLKDSKRYAYIQITDEAFPRLLVAREREGKGEFFGPFVSGQKRDYIIKFLVKLFRLRTCKKLPRRACLRYSINLCDAPCIGSITGEEYNRKISDIKLILKGKIKELVDKLIEDMKSASERLDFEAAIELREEITALEALREEQNMERKRKYDEDIIHYTVQNDNVYLLLFNIYKGILSNKSEFIFDYKKDFFEEFLTHYYSENEIPKEIILPHEVEDSISEFLTYKKKSKVVITVPKKGEKKKLLDLVKKNVEISFFGDFIKVEDLQKKLGLNDLPVVIECFDISHLSGTSTVGSMVQFRNGKADKSNYRRFKIKSPEAFQDDFAAIAEVVRRRYTRLKEENLPLPDLIIIDGGQGQLLSALRELKKLSLRIPTISIAKKFEEIYLPGRKSPLRMDRKEKALQFIQEIRDEAHRFAIAYNRLLRSKKIKE